MLKNERLLCCRMPNNISICYIGQRREYLVSETLVASRSAKKRLTSLLKAHLCYQKELCNL